MNLSSSAVSTRTPPTLRGWPFLGVALDMRIDPLRYLVQMYQQHGPVFRIRLLSQNITVMAGLEANRFLAQRGEDHLHSEDLFGGMARELGSPQMLVAIDGLPHRHQRKLQRAGYSKEVITSQLDRVVEITRQFTSAWQPGQLLPVFPTMQRIVTEQLGILLTGTSCQDHFDDLWLLFNMNMRVHVMKTDSVRLLQSARYQKVKARSMGFAQEVLDWHRANPPQGREPNLVDDLVDAVDEKGEPYSEGFKRAAILGAYFAGMDTVASTASFMLYVLLKTPGLLGRVLPEIDSIFNGEPLSASSLRAMPTLHHAAMETLRLYPVAPMTPRTVSEPFEFAGYHFKRGEAVYVANGVTHYLPEYFPNPDQVDVDRYDRPDQPKTAQAYAPYTLGAHTCLGAGMADVQLTILLATLLHDLRLQLDPPGYRLKVYANPIPNPGREFRVKVGGRR